MTLKSAIPKLMDEEWQRMPELVLYETVPAMFRPDYIMSKACGVSGIVREQKPAAGCPYRE